MSSLNRIARAALMCVAVFAARRSGAQSNHLAAARNAVAIARVQADSLRALVAADAAAGAALPVLRHYAGLEMRGDSSIIPPVFMTTLDSAFKLALSTARQLMGSVADTTFNGMVVSMTSDSALNSIDGRADIVMLRARRSGRFGGRYVRLEARHPDVQIATGVFLSWFEELSGSSLPGPIKRWAYGAAVPLRESERYVNSGTYVRLAMVRPALWTSCLEGARAACRALLALVPGNDTINAWYSEEQQRTAIRVGYEANHEFRMRPNAAAVPNVLHQCVPYRPIPFCEGFVHMYGQSRFGDLIFASPTSSYGRLELLRLALAHGGPDGFQRLIHSSATDIATILESISDVPLDSLISEWRAEVVAARPPTPRPSNAEFMGGLALSVLALGVSLRRRP